MSGAATVSDEPRPRPRSIRGLIGEAGQLALAAIVASAAVLLRDIGISRTLGRSAEADVLLAALMVATTVAQLVPGTFQTSVFAIAIETKLTRGAAAMHGLLGAISLRFVVLTGLLVLPLLVLGHPIARVITSVDATDELAVVLAILAGFAAAQALTDLAKSILGLERHYVAYAAVGGCGNLVLAALIVVRAPTTAREAALLACAAFAVALVVAWTVCLSMGLVRFVGAELPAGARRRIYAQAPASLGAGVLTIGMSVVDQIFTLSLGAGSYATLAFAQRWPLVATQLPALALGTVLLRSLAEDAVRLDPVALRARVRRLAALGLGLGLAACVGGLLLGPTIVRATLRGGELSAADADAVISVQNVLFLQAPFYVAGIVYLRVLNALQRNGVGFVIGAGALLLNASLDWALTRQAHLGVHGIALATVLVYVGSGTALAVAGELVLRGREAPSPRG